MHLLDVEARLLGVLIEKQLTTPDAYPLSANALRAGSNQKSNRDPHVDYMEAEVLVGMGGLMEKDLAERLPAGRGSRVERWEHRAADKLAVSTPELAVLAELLLRGPQAPGALRQRASRMHDIPTLPDLLPVLDRLSAKKLVRRLPPGGGSRSERWTATLTEHLVAPTLAAAPAVPPHPRPAAPQPAKETTAAENQATLEQRVAALEERLNALERELGTEPRA